MRAFAYLEGRLIYLAYLDEFGHVGPYVSRSDRRHNDSPVFGFAGFVMPAEEVRAFGTWFFQRKCELLDFEIRRSGKHPAVWEKKGSSLYRVANLGRYRGLRKLTGRLLTRIEQAGGHVFYAGIRKTSSPDTPRAVSCTDASTSLPYRSAIADRPIRQHRVKISFVQSEHLVGQRSHRPELGPPEVVPVALREPVK